MKHTLKERLNLDDRFNSVFITKRYFEESLILEVEPYDEIGDKTLNESVKQFNKFYNDLNNVIIKNFEKINPNTDSILINFYTNLTQSHHIITKDGAIY